MVLQPGAAISLQEDVQHFVADTLARCREIAAHGNAIFDNLLRLEGRLPDDVDNLEFRHQLPPHVQAAVIQVFNSTIQPHQRSAPKIRKACDKWNVERGVLFFYLGHTNSIAFWSAIKTLSDTCSSWPEALNHLHHAARTRRSGLLPGHPGVNPNTPGFLVFDVVQTCRLMGGLVSTERPTLNPQPYPDLLPLASNGTSSHTTETESVSASSAFRTSPGSSRALVVQEPLSINAGTNDKTDLEAHGEREQPNDEEMETDSRRPIVDARTDSVNSDTTPSTKLTASTSRRTTTVEPTSASNPNSETSTNASVKPTSANNPNSKTSTTTTSNMSIEGNPQKRPAAGASNEEKSPKKAKTIQATGHDSITSVTNAEAHVSPDRLKMSLDKITIAFQDAMVVDPQLLDKIAAGEHVAPQEAKETVKTFSSFIFPLRVNRHDWTMIFVTVDGEEPRAQFYDPAASLTNAEEAKSVVAAFLLHFFPHKTSDSLLFSRGFTPAYGLTSPHDSGVIAFLVMVYDKHMPITVNISLWRHIMAVLVGEHTDWSGLLSLNRKPPEITGEPERASCASAMQFLEWKREHEEWCHSTKEKLMARAARDMDAAYESLNAVMEARRCLTDVWQAINNRLMKWREREAPTSHPYASEKDIERATTDISDVLGCLKNKEKELRTAARACADERNELSLFF